MRGIGTLEKAGLLSAYKGLKQGWEGLTGEVLKSLLSAYKGLKLFQTNTGSIFNKKFIKCL